MHSNTKIGSMREIRLYRISLGDYLMLPERLNELRSLHAAATGSARMSTVVQRRGVRTLILTKEAFSHDGVLGGAVAHAGRLWY